MAPPSNQLAPGGVSVKQLVRLATSALQAAEPLAKNFQMTPSLVVLVSLHSPSSASGTGVPVNGFARYFAWGLGYAPADATRTSATVATMMTRFIAVSFCCWLDGAGASRRRAVL